MTPSEMWNAMDIPYTPAEAQAFNHELYYGDLAVANEFKNFIINNCNPTETMNLRVWDSEFEVKCNKFTHIGEKTTQFDLFDSYTGRIRRLHHTDIVKVPDLVSFRRFHVTALIHSLDGNVMSKTMNTVLDAHHWALSIHDALLLCPESADTAREAYSSNLEDIHTNRNEILTNYFQSIGIPASARDEWDKVKALVKPLTEDFKCNPMVLK